jgi:hypothetical protein
MHGRTPKPIGRALKGVIAWSGYRRGCQHFAVRSHFVETAARGVMLDEHYSSMHDGRCS